MPRDPTIRAFAVAIAGGSCSGKTTLTRWLQELLGDRCAVLDHDSYYRDQAHRALADRATVNFDHPDSLENDLLIAHLRDLRSGHAIEKPRYDFATHTRVRECERIAPCPIVLVEGILVLSLPELHAAVDLRVFVDTLEPIRYQRRVARDTSERGRTLQSVQEQWARFVQPMHARFVEPTKATADLVVSGTAPIDTTALQVLTALRARGAMP